MSFDTDKTDLHAWVEPFLRPLLHTYACKVNVFLTVVFGGVPCLLKTLHTDLTHRSWGRLWGLLIGSRKRKGVLTSMSDGESDLAY